MDLGDVRFWGYNIQRVHTDRQYEQLIDSHFDLYVLEVVVTEVGNEDFDIAGLVHDIRQHNIEVRGVDPLILAYVDVGQAEDWRWYWEPGWEIGDPEWIVGGDPNDWEGNYPVAYWYPTWEDIVIHGYEGRSHVEETLDAGFDGIYMDWVEAFSDESVIDKVQEDFGLTRPAARQRAATLMLEFISKIRSYARSIDPDYLIVAQNASDLYDFDPSEYAAVIDGIALEAIWFDGVNEDGDGDGVGAFDDWNDPEGFNIPTNDLYPGWTEEVLDDLAGLPVGFPVFCAEYAQNMPGQAVARRVYTELAPGVCVPYATRRSLARLSTRPYPLGYRPLDYSRPPSQPKLQMPADGATTPDPTPLFNWRNAYGYPTTYRLVVDDDDDFSSPVLDVDRERSRYTPPSPLDAGTYHWRVRARDAAGDWSPWSPTWSFTIS
jgi:cysteinyl-tRNA synthetase